MGIPKLYNGEPQYEYESNLFLMPADAGQCRAWARFEVEKIGDVLESPFEPDSVGLFIGSLKGLTGLRMLMRQIIRSPWPVKCLVFCAAHENVCGWGLRYGTIEVADDMPSRFLVDFETEEGAQFLRLCARHCKHSPL